MTTEAALKAWETRRANGWTPPNAQPKPKVATPSRKKVVSARTLGALKAWETRRANEAAAARKAAAKRKKTNGRK